MVHRKPCGCVIEIKYENSMKGLKTKVTRKKICPKHQKETE